MDVTRPCPEPFNLAAYVLAQGAQTPQKIALSLVGTDETEDWTYAALIRAVAGTARGFLDLGLTPGDRVLLRLDNTPDFPLAYLGALHAGLVPIPTAAALTLTETQKIIESLQPAAILHDPDIACPAGPVVSLSALRAMRDLPPLAPHMGDPNRPGYIIYTSGTSGRPMAVLHAHRAIWARRMMFDGWYGLSQADRLLHAGAFNWTYTLGTGLMDPWTVGATALIPRPGTSSAALLPLMRRERVSIFAAAPGVYRQMLRGQDPMDLPHLRHGLSAGEKLPESLRDRWEAVTSSPVFEAFGMSECSTFISSSPSHPAKTGTIGRPQPGRQISLRTPIGAAAANSEGVIAVHKSDPGLALGYVDAAQAFAKRFEGPWFLTGDIGAADPAGNITYLGRRDDMMNAGGFRVSPLEVEEALRQAPGINGIGVTEVEAKPGTRIIAAFYTSEAALDEDALMAFAKDRLARYKQPRCYIRLDTLPVSANGKLQRQALRATFEAENDQTHQT
ncbi:MAG: class I adenylate-forming enzyme family protein [Pseudomonadota bacterium]